MKEENRKENETEANEILDSKFGFLYNVQPVHLMFFASLPLCLGAFAGYKVEMKLVAAAGKTPDHYSPGSTATGGGLLRKVINEEVKATATSKQVATSNGKKAALANAVGEKFQVDAGRLAFKALGLGTMLSIGGVGLISALVIRASGCGDLNEAINTWREWTPRKRREVEDFFGIQPKSMQHEDVKATAHMTEDAEWEYIKKKYIPELSESDADGGSANS
eukprot:CAMPEP_0194091612 /NCGR_PEP_ID=MMETSP0149-20130528/43725_1 /TAXON_ID=122233 /ORGANISM="Chaetoceros debilis, Strain MM31A-1" /LENGTH=220 /DNA_ID=CAMNT_0038776263 /DNA_START=57 /DNA_END=719 /DNA_ORIENTATION=+